MFRPGPPAGGEVPAEAANRPLLHVWPQVAPDRHTATDAVVQVRLEPAPVVLVEAVGAVPGDGHRIRHTQELIDEEARERGQHLFTVVVDVYENGQAVPHVQFPDGTWLGVDDSDPIGGLVRGTVCEGLEYLAVGQQPQPQPRREAGQGR